MIIDFPAKDQVNRKKHAERECDKPVSLGKLMLFSFFMMYLYPLLISGRQVADNCENHLRVLLLEYIIIADCKHLYKKPESFSNVQQKSREASNEALNGENRGFNPLL